MASNNVSSEIWSSENDFDQVELILKRILYGIELKIYYAMVTIMISFILLGLLVQFMAGMYEQKKSFRHSRSHDLKLKFFRSLHLIQYCSRKDSKMF